MSTEPAPERVAPGAGGDAAAVARPRHVGLALLAMATGGFAIGTTEFVTMGLLPQIATGVGVSIPAAGRFVSADVLRRVEAGEQVTITSRGPPVAELVPVRARRRSPIARAELTRRLHRMQADAGLRDDLAQLAGETTDDLGPIR